MGVVYKEFLEELKTANFQKRIDDLAKKYKNNRIILYAAGILMDVIAENFDLSALNIIAISDIKY